MYESEDEEGDEYDDNLEQDFGDEPPDSTTHDIEAGEEDESSAIAIEFTRERPANQSALRDVLLDLADVSLPWPLIINTCANKFGALSVAT